MTGRDTVKAATKRHSAQRILADEHRELMSMFPTGVTVITVFDVGGNPCGMTCSSMTSVTLCPPTLLVCLRIGSRTCEAVLAGGGFAVNLLHEYAGQTARLFSTPVTNRFGQVRWCHSPSGHPWLVDDAFALAECRIGRSVEVSDHAVVFGEVKHVIRTAGVPLLYGMRRFASWRQVDQSEQPVGTAWPGLGGRPVSYETSVGRR